MFSFIYDIFERIKGKFSKKNIFSTPVPKSDKKFWKGYSCVIGDLNCIIHKHTNLLISYEGKLIGRYVDNEMIPIERLDPKIIQWYKDCGFEEPEEKV